MRKILFTIIAAAIGLSACKKEKLDVVDVSKDRYLQTDYWRLYEQIYTFDIDAEVPTLTSVYDLLPTCVKDNYYEFKENKEVWYQDHFIKCDPTDPDYRTYYYKLSADDKRLDIYANPDDPANSIIIGGSMVYDNIDTFNLTYEYWDEAAEKNSRVQLKYSRIIP